MRNGWLYILLRIRVCAENRNPMFSPLCFEIYNELELKANLVVVAMMEVLILVPLKGHGD